MLNKKTSVSNKVNNKLGIISTLKRTFFLLSSFLWFSHTLKLIQFGIVLTEEYVDSTSMLMLTIQCLVKLS
jgi:hypothetical protein